MIKLLLEECRVAVRNVPLEPLIHHSPIYWQFKIGRSGGLSLKPKLLHDLKCRLKQYRVLTYSGSCLINLKSIDDIYRASEC